MSDTREEQIAAALARELRRGRTPKEAAEICAIRFGLAHQVAADEELETEAEATVHGEDEPLADTVPSEAALPEADIDEQGVTELWDDALDLAAELDLPPILKKRVMKRVAKIGARIGRDALEVIERDILREMADFRQRDPEKLRNRAAKQQARGNLERAEELRVMAGTIEDGQ